MQKTLLRIHLNCICKMHSIGCSFQKYTLPPRPICAFREFESQHQHIQKLLSKSVEIKYEVYNIRFIQNMVK
jgi:hypothetical protein